jgi:TolB-like protein/Flp pilus assembly protein TadD
MIVVLIAILGVGLWNFYWRGPKFEPASKEKMALPLPDKPSIAVLPFVNMSDDAKQEIFSDGLTEDIITSLSKMPNIFVIARNSSFTYKGKSVKIQQVAEDLGVRYVLEGSVQRSGDRVRITAQLIDALKGYHVWSERYDREMKDIFALQDKITLETLKALDVKLSRGDVSRVHGMGTDNLEAYIQFLQGREIFQHQTKESNIQARQLFEEVIRLDPNYSNAYYFLAAVTGLDVAHGISKSPRESRMKAIELCQKAISLDGSNASAYAYMGNQYAVIGEHEKGIAACERAIEIAPNFTDVYVFFALVLNTAGRSEEAIPAIEKAFRFNPLNPPFSHYLAAARTYYLVGRYEDAARWSKELLSRWPNNIFGHQLLVLINAAQGREDEARAAAMNLLRINPDFTTQIYARAFPRKDLARDLELLRKAGVPDRPPRPLPDKPSIAVLPFVNMSDDKSQEYFSDGLTEEIITALSKTPKLFVIARNSTFVYKGKPVNVQQMSRELGVKYVLEGSVRRSGNQLRITAQLIDATTGNHLWAERFDREMKDVFAIQDNITLEIMKALDVKLSRGEMQGKSTETLEAYLKILQVSDFLYQFNKESNVRARELAEEAIRLDPNFARAYYGLAAITHMDVMLGLSKSPKDSRMKAIELCQKATSLDDTLAGAYGLLGYLYVQIGEYEKGIQAGERAIAIGPSSADAHSLLAQVLNFSGRAQEAIALNEKAFRLNPVGPTTYYYTHASFSYILTGRYEDAVKITKQELSRWPNNVLAHARLVWALSAWGHDEEANAAAQNLLRIDPKFSAKRLASALNFKDPSVAPRYLEHMRKAGLPE